jgi:hypothetical protein
MKKLFLFALCSMQFILSYSQDTDIKPAAKGVIYGERLTKDDAAVDPSKLESSMTNGSYEGKVTGKVKEVCKAMGCWISLEKADGTTLKVKSKDHGFFMPQNLVGRTVVVEGVASVKEITEAKRKHYAEDAGKSKEEINKIKGSSKEIEFIANGIEVKD